MPACSKAQKKIERHHFRGRRASVLRKTAQKMQQAMGQDPYLDTPN